MNATDKSAIAGMAFKGMNARTIHAEVSRTSREKVSLKQVIDVMAEADAQAIRAHNSGFDDEHAFERERMDLAE